MKIKRLLGLLLSLPVLAITACSFSFNANSGGEFKLNPEELSLVVGETYQLKAENIPYGYSSSDITWNSSIKSRVTVDSKGLVTAKAAGTSNVVAAVGDYNAFCKVTVYNESIYPTSIALNATSLEIGQGRSKTLSVTYTPSNVNKGKGVTFSSSNTSVATVNSTGAVTIKSGAAIGSTATITATSTYDTSLTASCVVTVTEVKGAAWTILIYMCGADLESNSEGRLATSDLQEIASVANQPSDVNIVVEAGGASSWASTYSSVINKSYLNRFHLENGSYVKDEQITYASMGLATTLRDFVIWGVDNYPAEKVGLIYWNHGGAMMGSCFDEIKNDDGLLNSERKTGLTSAFASLGRTVDKDSDKFEFIGYDCCLMQVQDVAEFDSHFARYGVASQELENGYGWDYDTWLDDLYSGKSTETILKAIVDGFIADNGGVDRTGSYYNQTLSYLDYSQMKTYKTAWENMASYLNSSVLSSSLTDSWVSFIKSVKNFGGDDFNDDYMDYCVFDVKDFLTKIQSEPSFYKGNMSTLVSAVESAFANLVKYSVCQKGAGNANGLSFWYYVDYYSSGFDDYYTTDETNFTKWWTVCNNYHPSGYSW